MDTECRGPLRRVPRWLSRSGPRPGTVAADLMHRPAGVTAAAYSLPWNLFAGPKVCSPHERHARRPGWTDLFFDLVFAAAIAQLSAPLDHDYSLYGIARFAFLLALVFLAYAQPSLMQHLADQLWACF